MDRPAVAVTPKSSRSVRHLIFRLFHVVSGDSQGYPDVWWVCTKDALYLRSGSEVG